MKIRFLPLALVLLALAPFARAELHQVASASTTTATVLIVPGSQVNVVTFQNVGTNQINLSIDGGSSAGGHLASTLMTHFDSGLTNAADPVDRFSCRPDLGVLCYPVITMGGLTHAGSRENLLGKNPTPELMRELSNELRVTPETPPCFIFHACDDDLVPVENSREFAAALRRAGVPFELHVCQRGGHGMGLGADPRDPDRMHPWTRECRRWLKERGFGK